MRAVKIDGVTWFECPKCGKPVRMKKVFGTLHVCLGPEDQNQAVEQAEKRKP